MNPLNRRDFHQVLGAGLARASLGTVVAANAACADPGSESEPKVEGAPPGDWRASLEQARGEFREQLEKLAARCDELGLAREAERTRRWRPPRDPHRRYLYLPAANDSSAPAANAEQVVKFWYSKFRDHRRAYAERLWELARQALNAHEPTAAYQLLHEALRNDPDHADVRRTLDLAPAGKSAATREIRSTAPRAEYAKLGWRAGQYWRAESPHFRVVTNHSAGAAVDLAKQLEEIHSAWRQVFFSFWSSEERLAARIAGDDAPLGRARQHDVVLHRSQDEYVAKLAPSVPQIRITLGIYLDEQRVAHLFMKDDSVKPTWWHETAHQLFQESGDYRAGVGKNSNMWAPEAAALYFESFRRGEDLVTLGGQDADRLQFARYRLLRGDFYLPLAELAALSRETLQKHPEISKLYGQAAAVGHFLVDGQQQRYHERFTRFLKIVYEGRASAASLFEQLDQTGEKLDEQFRASLQVTDLDLAVWPPCDELRNLSLGRTSVTATGLAQLSNPKKLEWLDLSFLEVGGEALESFRPATKLRQLFVERTRLDDDACATIAKFTSLEQLDLSRTRVTDRGLASLAELKRLEELDLTGCDVTDEGIGALKKLTQLKVLRVAETKVTPAGMENLRRALPKLNRDEGDGGGGS